MEFLLYGANGYTGQLITRFAADYKLRPVLAGRSRSKIEPLARQYQLDYLVFDLVSAQSRICFQGPAEHALYLQYPYCADHAA